MTFLLPMLPFYFFGNAHCLGMCGPLVSLLSRHPRKYEYFLGRLLSFTFVGWLCGIGGELIHTSRLPLQLAAWLSITLGIGIFYWGCTELTNSRFLLLSFLAKSTAVVHGYLASSLHKGYRNAPLLLGMGTILLPCGQSFLVFSTSALTTNGFWGALNASLFAIGTSPALLFALLTPHLFIKREKIHTHILGALAMGIGSLSILRGLADMGVVNHYHLALLDSVDMTLF